MAEVLYPVRRRPASDDKQGGREQFITCTEADCGETAAVTVIGTLFPSEMLNKKFIAMGWKTGRRGGGTCPACQAAKLATKRTRKPKSTETAMTSIRSLSDLVTLAAPVADAPRQPAREDKRRINAALEDVYLTEQQGYLRGHSDQTVAAELDVPWAWVAEVREDLFGPNHNEVTSALAEMFDPIREHVQRGKARLEAELAAANEQVAKAQARADKLAARLRSFDEATLETLFDNILRHYR